MIVPWQDIAPETLDNLIREFVLREGTDYGEQEVDLATKVEQIKQQLQAGLVVVVYSELHKSVDIQPHPKFR